MSADADAVSGFASATSVIVASMRTRTPATETPSPIQTVKNDHGSGKRPRGDNGTMAASNATSFYHLQDVDLADRTCRGLACFVARGNDPARWERACEPATRVYCLGKCYRSPATARDHERPLVAVHAREAIVLRNIAEGGATTLEAYRSRGGYRALELALQRPPEEIVRTLEASELRGRGGAGYPTGRKWRAVFRQPADEKYVVANADEGDPGAYIDRLILEDNPHGVIEALAIAGYAVGARRGYIYLRAEYPDARARLTTAIEQARHAGLLGAPLFGSDFSFDLPLEVGRGSYLWARRRRCSTPSKAGARRCARDHPIRRSRASSGNRRW